MNKLIIGDNLCQLDENNIPDLIKERLDKTIGKENYICDTK
jgi:hypothetical protein